MTNSFIVTLYSRPESVFTVDTISQIFPDISQKGLLDRLYYFAKVGKLQRLRKGIYAKNDYNTFELANKVYTPSYISLETVLAQEGVIFQHYTKIFLVSYVTRTITINETVIQYRQLRDDIVTNTSGIEKMIGYYRATKERAFLDAVFAYKNYHFDNLGILDWEMINMLKEVYKSKALTRRVEEYYSLYKKDYGKA